MIPIAPDSYVIHQNYGNRIHVFLIKNPLSYFPHGGKDDFAPSPVGEVPIAIGREGGTYINYKCNSKVNEARINLLH